MNVRPIVVKCSLVCVGALALGTVPSSRAFARADTGQAGTKYHGQAAGLIQAVRQATERFNDVSVAEAEGYSLMFGCVSGPDSGAMGLHYVNLPLVLDGVLDPAKPEIIIYEPTANGRLKITGADYLVFADAWDATHEAAPQLMGQLFHLFEAPNRFGLPAFYTLHVWAWKDNPAGTFVNWHTKVSCDSFNGPNQ